MTEGNESLKEDFKKELEKFKSETILSPAYRKKKTITWIIRTSIAALFYVLFWEYNWVRWSLILYIPLNLFGLFSIFGWNYLLRKKIAKTNQKIDAIELGNTTVEN